MGELRTPEELAQLVDNEGLGYAVQYYLGTLDEYDVPVEIKNAWIDAGDLLQQIDDYLEPYMP